MIKQFCAAILGMAAVSSLAQVQVIDAYPSGSSTPPPRTPVVSQNPAASPSGPTTQSVQLYYQLQTLQQEVQQLRGMVEEQAHEIKQLKQQRMDDYLDLDRRISQLSGGTADASNPDAPTGSTAAPVARDELADYRAAIDLVLKQQDYDQGILALEQHLVEYPDGRYAANAKYWLGQIYMLKNQLEQSRQWFTAMLADHPGNQKAPEAKFKLGKVYDLLGDKDKARSLLEEVAASNTSAATLARDYLRQNFSS